VAIPTSGSISLDTLQTEFGGTNPIEIDEYYRGGLYVPNTATNTGVPLSGTISLGNFYGTSSAPPPPTISYDSFTRSPTSIDEDGSTYVTFTLNTTGVSNGTTVGYTISGISTADISLSSLTGNITINSNTGSFSFYAIADATTEQAETATVTLGTTDSAGNSTGSLSASVVINDTSVCPAAGSPVGNSYCIGFDEYQNETDGNCGTTAVLVQANSTNCGYSPPPLSINVYTPFGLNGAISNYNWNGQTTSANSLTATSNTAYTTVSGGSGGYSYQWSLVSYSQATGDATLTASSFGSGQSSSTNGSITAYPNTSRYDSQTNTYYCSETVSITIRCTVTDSSGSTASDDISGYLSFFWQKP